MIAWVSSENGIACHWLEVGQRTPYPSQWMEQGQTDGSYLPPLPDFASHSPFGGATWFTPHLRILPNSE
jgi:hypothetical protein